MRVRLARSAVASAPERLAVAPRVTARAGEGVAFVGAPLSLRVEPFAYGGRAVVTVRRGTLVAQPFT